MTKKSATKKSAKIGREKKCYEIVVIDRTAAGEVPKIVFFESQKDAIEFRKECRKIGIEVSTVIPASHVHPALVVPKISKRTKR